MKFQRIGNVPRAVLSVPLAVRIAAFTLLLLSISASPGFADDELPPPADSADTTNVAPAPAPAPDAATSAPSPNLTDDSVPTPSLGQDALPEPGAESQANPAPPPPANDDLFLPAPAGNDSMSAAPIGRPSSQGYVGAATDDTDWQRGGMNNRPVFSLYAGSSFKSYGNAYVKDDFTPGITVGASLRVLSLGQTIFLHVAGDYSWFGVGTVGPTTGPGSVSNVKDETMHIGPMLELGLGRRFSLFGSLMRRQARVSADRQGVINANQQDVGFLQSIGEDPTWHLGVGAQWDFYVIPHGSIGLHALVEQDLFALTLTFAMEPVPRKKLSLGYEEME